MPFGTEIKRCTPYPDNRWICSYIVWLKCGCAYNRYTVSLIQEQQPTESEILKAIAQQNEDKDQ